MSKEHISIILKVVTTHLLFLFTALSYLAWRLRESVSQHKPQPYLPAVNSLPNFTWNKEAIIDLREKLENAQKFRQEILKDLIY